MDVLKIYLVSQAEFLKCVFFILRIFYVTYIKTYKNVFDSNLLKKHILSNPHFSVNIASQDSIIYHCQGHRKSDTFTSL